MLNAQEIQLVYGLLTEANDFFATIEDKCIKAGVTDSDRISYIAECLGVDPDAWSNWREGD
jgi:3,4-dihydroxy-2-butanone 4-phosphate synthase